MLRTTVITVTSVMLGLGVAEARADHDKELRYVVGGALIGAALGELAYSSHRHDRRHGYGRHWRGRFQGHHGYYHGYGRPPFVHYRGRGHRYDYFGRYGGYGRIDHRSHRYCRH